MGRNVWFFPLTSVSLADQLHGRIEGTSVHVQPYRIKSDGVRVHAGSDIIITGHESGKVALFNVKTVKRSRTMSERMVR